MSMPAQPATGEAAFRAERLFTIGHSTLEADGFVQLLRDAGVAEVADVRAHPGSRRHPHFERSAMSEWLAEAGIAYRWEGELGGRRKEPADSPDTALDAAGFRAYAAHMRTGGFWAALDEVLAAATDRPVALMCAESVWWRCHRRLIADAAVLVRGVTVEHVMPDGRTQQHPPIEVARLTDGGLVYDGAQPQALA